MTHYLNNHGGDRLKSEGLDNRHGTFDAGVPKSRHPMKQESTTHERARHGADVRSPNTSTGRECSGRIKASPQGILWKDQWPRQPILSHAHTVGAEMHDAEKTTSETHEPRNRHGQRSQNAPIKPTTKNAIEEKENKKTAKSAKTDHMPRAAHRGH
jgi:hypothetical protein